MHRFLLLSLLTALLSTPFGTSGLYAQGAGLAFAPVQASHDLSREWPKKKKKKKRTLAVGAVVGDPSDIGGRLVLRSKSFGFAGDVGIKTLRTDLGLKRTATTFKGDVRFYAKGLWAKLLRPYAFAGSTFQRARYDGETPASVVYLDAGVGGGIKLWRLSINAEAGLLIPALGVPEFNPGFGVFTNVSVLIWLL